jgi:hypothetical protein
MKKIKALLAVATLAFLGSTSTQAAAAVDPYYNWGTLTVTSTVHQEGAGGAAGPGDTFNDVYTFSLAAPGAYSDGSVASLDFSQDYGMLTGLTGTVSLLGLATNQSYAFGGTNGYTPTNLSFGKLAAGAYTLTVSGAATGVDGGVYAFGMNFTPAPVPEPESLAMMMAGLGLMAAVARRRKLND